MKFIEVTFDNNSDVKAFLNVNHIVGFTRVKYSGYTSITLTNDELRKVKETPEQLLEMIKAND